VLHAQAFAGTEYGTPQWNDAHVDLPRLLIGIDQAFAAIGVQVNFDEDFITHAPTGAEQPVTAFITATVVTLPLNRQ